MGIVVKPQHNQYPQSITHSSCVRYKTSSTFSPIKGEQKALEPAVSILINVMV